MTRGEGRDRDAARDIPPRSIYDEPEPEIDAIGSTDEPDPDIEERPERTGQGLSDPKIWLTAERETCRSLIDAVAALTRYDERLRHLGADADAEERRSARRLVSMLLGSEGLHVSAGDLYAHERDRRTSTCPGALEAARGAWFVSRLLAPGSRRLDREHVEALSAPRDVTSDRDPAWSVRVQGVPLHMLSKRERSERIEAWLMATAITRSAHPITRGAYAQHAWRALGLGGFRGTTEALVLGAMASVDDPTTRCRFAPLGPVPRRAGRAPAEELAAWCRRIERGSEAAVNDIERGREWRRRALELADAKEGSVVARMIHVLGVSDELTIGGAAKAVGVSVTWASRTLSFLERRGVATEVTRRARWRIWRPRFAAIESL